MNHKKQGRSEDHSYTVSKKDYIESNSNENIGLSNLFYSYIRYMLLILNTSLKCKFSNLSSNILVHKICQYLFHCILVLHSKVLRHTKQKQVLCKKLTSETNAIIGMSKRYHILSINTGFMLMPVPQYFSYI